MENKQNVNTEVVASVRKAIEDRATWFRLLMQGTEAAGADSEKIARKAIYEFGCMKGSKMKTTDNMSEFIEQFAGTPGRDVFEMQFKEVNDNRSVLEFNYCPLVECWRRLGCEQAEMDRLCDWAMEGDRGVMSNFPAIEMEIEKRIGAGDCCCRLVFNKK